MMSRTDSRYTSAMRTAQVSELKERLDEVIEAVKNGETTLAEINRVTFVS